jgi:hypothetical protein
MDLFFGRGCAPSALVPPDEPSCTPCSEQTRPNREGGPAAAGDRLSPGACFRRDADGIRTRSRWLCRPPPRHVISASKTSVPARSRTWPSTFARSRASHTLQRQIPRPLWQPGFPSQWRTQGSRRTSTQPLAVIFVSGSAHPAAFTRNPVGSPGEGDSQGSIPPRNRTSPYCFERSHASDTPAGAQQSIPTWIRTRA